MEDPEYVASLDKFSNFQFPQSEDNLHVKEGDFVLLESEDKSQFFQVTKDAKVKFLKKQVQIGSIIGQEWDSVFEIHGGALKRTFIKHSIAPITKQDADDLLVVEEKEANEDTTTKKNINNAQKMGEEEIVQMRSKGASGAEIIQALMENSATFQGKTEFSKQKYINKKKKKYLATVSVVRPSAYTICQSFHMHKPEKICYLRPDTLAQILSFGNIHAHERILVVDTCQGLVTGTIAERTGGHAEIINIQANGTPASALKYFNFPTGVMDSIHNFPLRELYTVKNYTPVADGSQKTAKDKAKELLKGCGDSLVIVTHYDPEGMLFELWPYLAPSSPFVLFYPHLQQLAECQDRLVKQGWAVKMELMEIWMRDYQVLPDRTHPMMKMHAASGYILAGMKVLNTVESEESAAKKQKTESDSTATSTVTTATTAPPTTEQKEQQQQQ